MTPLPELHEAVLDAGTLRQLFGDVGACASQVEVLLKGAPAGRASAGASLDAALELLLSGGVRGVQLRYAHEGVDWWDTLLPAEGGHRLVRMRAPVQSISGSAST